jgi:hypothetical protein
MSMSFTAWAVNLSHQTPLLGTTTLTTEAQ